MGSLGEMGVCSCSFGILQLVRNPRFENTAGNRTGPKRPLTAGCCRTRAQYLEHMGAEMGFYGRTAFNLKFNPPRYQYKVGVYRRDQSAGRTCRVCHLDRIHGTASSIQLSDRRASGQSRLCTLRPLHRAHISIPLHLASTLQHDTESSHSGCCSSCEFHRSKLLFSSSVG